MAGFNMDKLLGKSTSAVGAGLLNPESQKAVSVQRRTEFIPFSSITPNPRNEMSMSGIDELASQIKISGLDQPLVVYQKEDGNYMILTGHRRYTAIKTLIERGEWDAEKQPVECKIKDLDGMDVPLELEDKEMLSLLVTNQTRTKTDADIAFEIKEWKKIISKLRAKGIDFMVAGYDETGEVIKTNIVGVKTQELVANQMGISSAQVAKYNKVENQGSEALKNALKTDKININNAAAVASMPKEEQEQLIEEALQTKEEGEKINSDDITVAKRENETRKTVKESKTVKEELPKGFINDKIFKQEIKSIQKAIKASEGIQLTDAQYIEYCRYLNGLKKVFSIE